MWNKLVNWHRKWEEDNLRLLENPALAEAMAPGWRRSIKMQTGKMSDIERLQLLEFSRKYRGWRSYAWLAAGFALLSMLGVLAHTFMPHKSVFQLVIAANMMGGAVLFCFTIAWFNYRQIILKPFRTSMVVMGGLVLGLATSVLVGGLKKGVTLDAWLQTQSAATVLGVLGAGVCFLVALGVISMWRNKEFETVSTRMQLDAERERSARILSESQLRLLRAQIEPHFLFNTLGAVQQLAQDSAPRAAELTANLIAFLRSSMDGMRRDSMPLRDDFALVNAYLQVMQVRMGQRLHYTLDLPDALAHREVPGMMLLTLVENAIKHGIEPALRGGEVLVSAAERDGMLHLSVCDSGVGLAGQPGNGDGLSNVQQRLDLAYAGAARLSLVERPEGGVAADIVLPLEKKAA